MVVAVVTMVTVATATFFGALFALGAGAAFLLARPEPPLVVEEGGAALLGAAVARAAALLRVRGGAWACTRAPWWAA